MVAAVDRTTTLLPRHAVAIFHRIKAVHRLRIVVAEEEVSGHRDPIICLLRGQDVGIEVAFGEDTTTVMVVAVVDIADRPAKVVSNETHV
jgi:hypothetical protein